MQIKATSGKVIFESAKAKTIKEVVEESIRASVDLSHADLSGADLELLKFGSQIQPPIFKEAKLIRSNFSMSELVGSNFSKANLAFANLFGANLAKADLSGANLTGANLIKACLSSANLSGANLTDAQMTGAVLDGANLDGVTK